MNRRRGLIERLRGRRPASSRTIRPTGTVTFVLTDIEGSTRLWETEPAAMERAILRHGAIVAGAVEQRRGTLVRERGEGDSTFSVFPHASDAVAAAIDIQRGLGLQAWEPGVELRVRIALHTGEAYLIDDEEYASPVINRCARIREVAYGGQILTSEQTIHLAEGDLPAGASVLDLGPHRLRDLSRPVRIYQLLHTDLPQTFPKLRSLEAGLHNLPVQLTSFIGRDREVAEVRKHLTSSRVLNLVGPGGIGKTRLALQAAGDLVDAYPDGIWFVDLASVSEPAMVPQALATALSLREERGRPVTESLIEHLRTADALVALDNCEHLIDAASEFATNLLRSCAELNILATGREALRVPGATTWRVPALAVPDDTVPTEALGTFESIRLFTERAGLVRPDFALSHDTGPIVARICRRLDGVPLAIELAAANVASMSVADIEARLDDRFGSLTRGGPPDVPRHGTLQATVDWSHDLLGTHERVLFRRLAVFVGGFTLEGAEDVCSSEPLARDDVVSLLTNLVDKSLVVLDDVLDTTRYVMLETIRDYANEKLVESGELDATLDHHASYFAGWSERVASALEGPDEAAIQDTIATELPNLRRAIAHLFTSRPDEGLRLTARLRHFWAVRGLQSEAIDLLATGLAAVVAPDAELEGLARIVAGSLLRQHARFPDSRAMLERGLELRREHGTAADVGEALVELGNTLHQLGDHGAAERAYSEGLELAREAGAERAIVGALNGLGIIALSSGRPADAASIYDEMIVRSRRIEVRRILGTAVSNRGIAALELGDVERARGHVEEALHIARELGDSRFLGVQLMVLGAIELERGDHTRARELTEESLALSRELNDSVGQAQALYRLGELARGDGRSADGDDVLEQSLAIWRSLGSPDGVAFALVSLGLNARLTGNGPLAQERLHEATRTFEALGGGDGLCRCAEAFAGLSVDEGDARTAAILLGAATRAREQTGTTRNAIDAPIIEADVVRARDALGPRSFEAAWDEGTRTSLRDALAIVLGPDAGQSSGR